VITPAATAAIGALEGVRLHIAGNPLGGFGHVLFL